MDSNDMTKGRILPAILKFSVPLLIGNVLQQLYFMFDSFIVGKKVGDSALAAVGASGTLINFLISFVIGASTGAGVLISIYYGRKDNKNISVAVHSTMILGLILGVVISVAGIMMSHLLLEWIDTPDDMMEQAVTYLRIFFSGMLFNTIYQMAAGILNAVGNSRRSLMYLACASLTNIGLDFLFVVGFETGVAGAAVATVISQALSCVLAVGYLFRTGNVYRLQKRSFRWNPGMLKKIIKVGIPTAVQNSVIGFSNVLIQSGVNSYGTNAVAGFTAYMSVDGFDIMPILSLSLSATTFVGQNVGAGRFDRVRKGCRNVVLMTSVYTAVVSAIMMIFDREIISIFSENEEVIENGIKCVWILAPFYIVLGIVHSLAGTIRGSGNTIQPMIIILFSFCLFRIGWMLIAAPKFSDVTGVLLTYPTSFILCASIMTIYFFTGKWLDHKRFLSGTGNRSL